jgi:transposase-like protein
MFRAVPKQIKEEVLVKVKEGQKVADLARQYGISDKTVYTWLAKSVTPEVSLVEYNRIKRENEELKRIIGIMALDLELEKKRKISRIHK